MTRDEVIALVDVELLVVADVDMLHRFAAAIEARVRADDPALRLVADIRFALGDDGKRMSDELVEYCRELRKDVERLDWLIAHSDATICASSAYGPFFIWHRYSNRTKDEANTPRAAIDAAMQTQAPTGA